MAILKCKMCGGNLTLNEVATVVECEYCGTKQTIPRLDDEKKANLYDRANHFRRNNDYDKAMGIYEQILLEDSSDSEAYWSIVLCRYGVEYVEDPVTRKRVPTVNRTQFSSIFTDPDYKATINHADSYQKEIYESEAKAIDDIQQGILEISSKEEPFDVFICYKETDKDGRRTRDSVLATDLYHQLTKEGFKVFFSRISLEDKLGTAYEPYIFAALNSAKVMVVLGTKPEYFSAVWVKNEWSRYLSLIKNGAKKTIIPAYRDMDPYDLPEEFSHLQAQDMSKLGFMQDLIRGIKKILQAENENSTSKKIVNNTNDNIHLLLKRVFIFLEDKEWASADEYCEKVLDKDPENAHAYLGKLLAELKVSNTEYLKKTIKPLDNSINYKRLVRYADEELLKEINSINAEISNNRIRCEEEKKKEGIYNEGLRLKKLAKYDLAINQFSAVFFFKDSKEQIEECKRELQYYEDQEKYYIAIKQMEFDSIAVLSQALKSFKSMPYFKDSAKKIVECETKIKRIELLEEKKAHKGLKGFFKK